MVTSMDNDLSFNDYKVLRLKLTESSKVERHIFYKSDNSNSSHPAGRTLFVCNIPPALEANHVKHLFLDFGAVEEVYLEGEGFKKGHLVFTRGSSVQKALYQAKDVVRVAEAESRPLVTGLAAFARDYGDSVITDVDGLMSRIEASVAEIDAQKNKVVADAEALGEADEDGWVTVSRHTSKKPVVSGLADTKAAHRIKVKEAKKRKRKELENFYRQQVKESKLRKLDELKAKFECDKKKQLEMKSQRKFRPA